MPFKQGTSGNPEGRPVKVVDNPEALRNEIHSFLAGQLGQIKKDWKILKPRDRVAFFERLCRYILPGPDIDLSRFSERDLDVLINRLKTKLNGQETN